MSRKAYGSKITVLQQNKLHWSDKFCKQMLSEKILVRAKGTLEFGRAWQFKRSDIERLEAA